MRISHEGKSGPNMKLSYAPLPLSGDQTLLSRVLGTYLSSLTGKGLRRRLEQPPPSTYFRFGTRRRHLFVGGAFVSAFQFFFVKESETNGRERYAFAPKGDGRPPAGAGRADHLAGDDLDAVAR